MDMQIISKISKGSKMDQIYLPKNRAGFNPGTYVTIRLLASEQEKEIKRTLEKPYFYGLNSIEPIKTEIINKIFEIVESNLDNFENIIITGSFLEKGFGFNDVDILIISNNKINENPIMEKTESKIGIRAHIISLNSRELVEGLATDPIYENMLSKCVAKKRIVFNIKRKINSQILDLHLLKSKSLLDNFDFINGSEKYYLTKNMLAILLFLKGKKINNEAINNSIKSELGVDIKSIRENLLEKSSFIKKFREVYDKTLKLVFESVKKEN